MPFLRRISGDQLWRNFAAIQLPDGAHARLSAIMRSIPTSSEVGIDVTAYKRVRSGRYAHVRQQWEVSRCSLLVDLAFAMPSGKHQGPTSQRWVCAKIWRAP